MRVELSPPKTTTPEPTGQDRKLTRYSTIIRPGRLLLEQLMDFLEGDEKYTGNIIQDQGVPHPQQQEMGGSTSSPSWVQRQGSHGVRRCPRVRREPPGHHELQILQVGLSPVPEVLSTDQSLWWANFYSFLLSYDASPIFIYYNIVSILYILFDNSVILSLQKSYATIFFIKLESFMIFFFKCAIIFTGSPAVGIL